MGSKIYTIFLILLFIIINFAYSSLTITSIQAQASNTLSVGIGMEYVTIQEAINHSKPGDTIYVSNGLYIGHLNISKSITLIGEEKNQTMIVPSGMKKQDLINITANGVTLSNLTLFNPDWYYYSQSSGIKLHGVNDCSIVNITISLGYFTGLNLYNSEFNIIKNNNISSNYINGISLKISDNNLIEDNNISMNQENGLILDSSKNNVIKNNDFMNNYWVDLNFDKSSNNHIINNHIIKNMIYESALGIRIKSSMNNTYKNNKMDNSGFTLRGDSIAHWNTHTIDVSNRVNDKPVYYLTNQENDSIPFDAGQVILANCTNIDVKYLDLSYCTESIILGFSSNNKLAQNKIFFSKRHGLVLYRSSNNMIENNSCGRTEWYFGAYLNYSNNNTLLNNNISHCNEGIHISNSNNNQILNNSLYQNWWNNINLHNSSNSTLISNNFSNYWIYDNLKISYSTNITLINNTFQNVGINIYGSLKHWNSHHIDNSNTINGKPIFYYKNMANQKLPINNGDTILANCSNILIDDQYLNDVGIGFLIGHSSEIEIKNNTLANNDYGILLYESNNIFINFNNCSNNTYGIKLSNSYESNLTGNQFWENIWGVEIVDSHNNSIFNNTCNLNSQAGLSIKRSENIVVKNNNCLYNKKGIILDISNLCTIENNICNLNNGSGLDIEYGGYNSIINNSCNFNIGSSILFRNTNNNSLIENTCNQNGNGIHISNSNDNLFKLNSVRDNDGDGIHLVKSHRNNILNNDFLLNNISGVDLQSSNYNIVSKNNIIMNKHIGVDVNWESVENLIYHNTILGYEWWAIDSSGLKNHWNLSYPGGGNYWGNYSGTDNYMGPRQDINGSDGFGDIPYIFPEDEVTDYYPLMFPMTDYTSIPLPFQPQNITISPGKDSIILTWSPPIYEGHSPITRYNIYRRERNSFIIEKIADLGNVTQFEDKNVREGELYHYNITAENEFGEGPSSEEIDVIPVYLPETEDTNYDIMDVLNPIRCATLIILLIIIIIILIIKLVSRRRLRSQHRLKDEPKKDEEKKE